LIRDSNAQIHVFKSAEEAEKHEHFRGKSAELAKGVKEGSEIRVIEIKGIDFNK
jgi:hypothetical protein